jgi:hypothetical protein
MALKATVFKAQAQLAVRGLQRTIAGGQVWIRNARTAVGPTPALRQG